MIGHNFGSGFGLARACWLTRSAYSATMFEQELALARGALAAGDLVVSENACRDILDAHPGHATALNLLGIVAIKAGAAEQAAGYFQAALAANPGDQTVAGNLEFLKRQAAPKVEARQTRYLLIKAWGCGFWSDVSHVLGALLLAEITGRIPVIHWGGNSLFGDGSGADAFRLYFQPVSDATVQDLARMEGASFFPPKWNRSNLAGDDVAKWEGAGSRAGAVTFLGRPESIAVSDFYFGVVDVWPWIPGAHPLHGKSLDEIYRHLIDRYLRPQAGCVAAGDAFLDRHLRGAPFAAVHLRGSDKIIENPHLHLVHDALLAEVAAIDPGWRIFLLTDDEHLLARMRTAHGMRLVAADCRRSGTSQGVHFGPAGNRVQAGLEVMQDALVALSADRFVGNGRSNVSAMIALMKAWAPGDCVLVRPNQLMERNPYIYRR